MTVLVFRNGQEAQKREKWVEGGEVNPLWKRLMREVFEMERNPRVAVHSTRRRKESSGNEWRVSIGRDETREQREYSLSCRVKYQDKEEREDERGNWIFLFLSGSLLFICVLLLCPYPHHTTPLGPGYACVEWTCDPCKQAVPFILQFAQSIFFCCFPFHSSSPQHKQSATPIQLLQQQAHSLKHDKNRVHRSARKSIAPRTPFLNPSSRKIFNSFACVRSSSILLFMLCHVVIGGVR